MKESYYSSKRIPTQPTAEAADTNVPSHLVSHAFRGLLFAGFKHDELARLTDQELMEKYKASF